MRKLGTLILIGSILIPAISFAKESPVHTCRIIIKQVSTSGEKNDIVFDSKLRNKQDCVALAKMHMPNFTPDIVSSKQVLYHWYR